MTKDEAFSVFKDAVSTHEQLKDIYIRDVTCWKSQSSANERKWKSMTLKQKQAVADLWKEGKGLYTLESCIVGRPELVFPAF